MAIKVAATIAPQLKLPEWVPTTITVVVGPGFPITLVLAWVFDITPEGIRLTGEFAPGPGLRASLRRLTYDPPLNRANALARETGARTACDRS